MIDKNDIEYVLNLNLMRVEENFVITHYKRIVVVTLYY